MITATYKDTTVPQIFVITHRCYRGGLNYIFGVMKDEKIYYNDQGIPSISEPSGWIKWELSDVENTLNRKNEAGKWGARGREIKKLIDNPDGLIIKAMKREASIAEYNTRIANEKTLLDSGAYGMNVHDAEIGDTLEHVSGTRHVIVEVDEHGYYLRPADEPQARPSWSGILKAYRKINSGGRQ